MSMIAVTMCSPDCTLCMRAHMILGFCFKLSPWQPGDISGPHDVLLRVSEAHLGTLQDEDGDT